MIPAGDFNDPAEHKTQCKMYNYECKPEVMLQAEFMVSFLFEMLHVCLGQPKSQRCISWIKVKLAIGRKEQKSGKEGEGKDGRGVSSVAGPCLWNSLPVALRDRDISLVQFKRLLKTLWFV